MEWNTEPAIHEAVGRILLIGGDASWVHALSCHLEAEGFAVGLSSSTAGLRSRLAELQAEVIVADAGTHGSVAALSASVRAVTDALLLVTGRSESDVVAATMAGADSYSSRSASVRVLTARARVLLRRYTDPRTRNLVRTDVLAVGGLKVRTADFEPHEGGDALVVDEVSFAFLGALLRRPGVVVTRVELMREIGLAVGNGSALDLAVRRLRELLERRVPGRRIVAVRGVGYRYAGEDETDGPGAGCEYLDEDDAPLVAGGVG